jgi:hypothetical protein
MSVLGRDTLGIIIKGRGQHPTHRFLRVILGASLGPIFNPITIFQQYRRKVPSEILLTLLKYIVMAFLLGISGIFKTRLK